MRQDARSTGRINLENQLLDVLHDGPASISDIALETGMTLETVRRLINQLVEDGIVVEWGKLEGRQGRPIVQWQLTLTKAPIDENRRGC